MGGTRGSDLHTRRVVLPVAARELFARDGAIAVDVEERNHVLRIHLRIRIGIQDFGASHEIHLNINKILSNT